MSFSNEVREQMRASKNRNPEGDEDECGPVQAGPPKAMWNGPMTSRQCALGVLEKRIEARRQELADLDALYRALPRELSPEADRALWNLLMAQRIG